MNDNKPTKLTDSEIWQLRALDAQVGKLAAEAELVKQYRKEVQGQMEELTSTLREKYGDAQVTPEGFLVYPDAPPDVPENPDKE